MTERKLINMINKLQDIKNSIDNVKSSASASGGRATAGRATAGRKTGGVSDFTGGAKRPRGRPCKCVFGGVSEFAGSALEGGKRRKRGRPRKSGGVLEGSALEGSGRMTAGARKKRTMKSKVTKEKQPVPKQLRPWFHHLRTVRGENLGMPYKDVLKLAKDSFK